MEGFSGIPMMGVVCSKCTWSKSSSRATGWKNKFPILQSKVEKKKFLKKIKKNKKIK
jgi:hypothetical protein